MENLPINITDIVVLGVLLLSALLALARGFVREVLAIAGWIGAGFVTVFLLPNFQEPARAWFKKEWEIEETLVADIAVGAVIFIAALIVFTIITIVISKRIQASEIGPLDRSLGFMFGLVRGVFVVCLAYFVLVQFMAPKEHPKWIKEAKSLPPVEAVVVASVKALPEKWRKNVKTPESWTDQLLNKLGGATKLLKDGAKKIEGYTEEQRKQLDRLFPKDEKKDGEKKDEDKK